jgi:hypothetical protein
MLCVYHAYVTRTRNTHACQQKLSAPMSKQASLGNELRALLPSLMLVRLLVCDCVRAMPTVL